MFKIPQIYVPPLGTPLYWRDELSGQLPDAMWAFLKHTSHPGIEPAPTKEQINLLREYFQYYIFAPCWQTSNQETEFAQLRTDVQFLHSAYAIEKWIERCLEIGLDPI